MRGPAECPPADSRARQMASLLVCLVVTSCFQPVDSSTFVLETVQHRPTNYIDQTTNLPYIAPPTDLRQERLNTSGFIADVDSSVQMSRHTHVGCFSGNVAEISKVEEGANADPNECLKFCYEDVYGSNVSYLDIVLLMQGQKCTCALRSQGVMADFVKVAENQCNLYCKYFQNPYCGGEPNFYSIYLAYDYQALTGQGAFDPWRYCWYTVVVVKESTLNGGGAQYGYQAGMIPEHYYLHATNTFNGLSQYQYSAFLNGLLYGIQYDIDNSRLVSLYTALDTGRIRADKDWSYKLSTITINTTIETFPDMQMALAPVAITLPESEMYLGISGASAILGTKNADAYITTQVGGGSVKRTMKDMLYVIRIPDGYIIREVLLGFKVMQLFANEKFGDITALGPVVQIGQDGAGAMEYIYIGRVYRSEVEDKVVADISYTTSSYSLVVPVKESQNWWIYPGVNSNEHLFNKSAILTRFIPPGDTANDPPDRSKAAPLVLEINLRTESITPWCEGYPTAACKGSMSYEIPYAGLYNKEPGIPLSLRSPTMVLAQFTMSAGSIKVVFDRPTMKLSVPVDENYDKIPDYIDDSDNPTGQFDCGRVFDAASVELLGPYDDTYCVWMSENEITIKLPRVINISVGDSIFLMPDVIYTKPYDGEWSPAATGGVQVSLPDPLEYPVIIWTQRKDQIDPCSPVILDARDSDMVGGLPTFTWYLQDATDDDPNPVDLTSDPFRVWSPEQLQQVRDALAAATANNSGRLEMPSNLLEPAATYKFVLNVTSRWLVTTSKVVQATKLSFSAPSVYIQGQEEIVKTRPERITLTADGKPSECEPDLPIAYRWVVTAGDFDFDDYPEMVTNAKTLTLPSFTLSPPTDPDVEFNIYNFTVECYIDTPMGNVPEKTARAVVTVKIRRADIYVVFRTEDRMITQGDVLVLDARASQDPDYPTPESMTFKGTFEWYCLTPIVNGLRSPCFGNDPAGKISQLQPCRLDIGTKIQDGGVTFQAPLFDDLTYCQYARGVLMSQTADFVEGEYKFKVKVFDRELVRTAEKEVLITISLVRVLKLVLSVVNAQDKYPITETIRIVGVEEGKTPETAAIPRTYSWRVLTYQLTQTDEQAEQAANNPDAAAQLDMYSWIDITSELDPLDPARFAQSPETPNLIIYPNVLQPTTQYKFRLSVDGGNATGFSDIAITTAGLAPRSGTLTVDPINGTSGMERTLTADNWDADDKPLTYHFGFMSQTGQTTFPKYLGTDPIPVSRLVTDVLPVGEPSTNYSLLIIVKVATPYGATTVAQAKINNYPPENVTQAVNDQLAKLDDVDGASLVDNLNGILSMDPNNTELQNTLLDAMEQNTDQIPPTPSQLEGQAAFISSLVDSGNDGDAVMNALEGLVITSADSGSINANPNGQGGALPGLLFGSLGGLTPNDDPFAGGAPDGARRLMLSNKYDRSNTMLKYRNPNPSFRVRENMKKSRDPMMQYQVVHGRQTVNHPPGIGLPGAKTIDECPTAWCDEVFLSCMLQDSWQIFTCCDANNGDTLCNDPPCWFKGLKCPASQFPVASPQRLDGGLVVPKDSPRRLSKQPPIDDASESIRDGNWFGQWSAHNFPLSTVDEGEQSDWDRSSAYQGWHPNVYRRKLQYATVDPARSQAETLLALEQDESNMLISNVKAYEQQEYDKEEADLSEAKKYVQYEEMDPQLADLMRAQDAQKVTDAINHKMEFDRNKSQRLTRINVMRDTVAKALITQLIANEVPLKYPTSAFDLTLGKTTNLSQVHSSFIFPAAFQVPPDSPDSPTPDNPVTGFAFEFVEYKRNIYAWSESNPVSYQSKVVTLIALKANADDLDIHEVTNQPIRVYTDLNLFSQSICLYWDRFAKDTAGGAWSRQGVTNNETECLTTNLSDVGIFMDPKVPEPELLIAIDFEKETWQSHCIGCSEEWNMFVLAVMGMVVFTDILLILMGFVLDETRRTDMAKENKSSRYYEDGDGIHSRLNVDDAIAYSYTEGKLVMLWLGTFLNVIMREHVIVSPLFYHEIFTRPQRLLCFGALLTGLLALNALVQSQPGYLITTTRPQEYMVSGILGGLLVFPVYCGLALMFNMRPRPVKKRIIKRTYNPREIDLIAQKRKELDHKSSLMPPAGYLSLPPMPPGGITHNPGGTSLLGLPSPLPLPPLPPQAPGGSTAQLALPPPPPPGTGLPGIPALPALPGTATGNTALPPPPRYPPPRGAKAPQPAQLLPPINFPKIGPPPKPGQAPYGAEGWSNLALDNGSTGETPSRLPLVDAPMAGSGQQQLALAAPSSQLRASASSPSAAPAAPGNASREVTLPPGALVEDPKHGMMAPGATDDGTPRTPVGGMPEKPPLPGAGVGGFATPPSSRGVSARSGTATPQGFPEIASLSGTGQNLPMPVFVRGQPYQELAPPFQSTLAGPPRPPGMPPGPPGPPGMPPPAGTIPGRIAPLPPPPPKEDDQAFVRRIRLTYMDKVIKEHEKHDLLEDHDELGKEVKWWIFWGTTLLPYAATCIFISFALYMTVVYGVKFDDNQALHWVYGSVIGLGLIVLLLDIFKSVMMTLVELRMYENRRKSKAGDFLPRRVKREEDRNFQKVPAPRLWKNAVAATAVPKGTKTGAPQMNARPSFLPPPPGGPPTPGSRPPGLPPGASFPGSPPNRPGALPVAPPQNFASAFGVPGGFTPLERGYEPRSPGPGTPRSIFSGTGPLGSTPPPPPGRGTTSPGTATPMELSGSGQMPRGQPLPRSAMPSGGPSTSGLSPQRVDMPEGAPRPAPPSPTHSTHSLSSLARSQAQTLDDKVKASRHATPPPPPGRTPGTQTPPGAKPKPPDTPEPGFTRPSSRPNSRPPSAGSAAARKVAPA